MTKDELRKQIKEEIKKLSAAERDTQSLYVCLQVIGSAEWQQAESVLLYAALPDEVNLQLLIDDAMGSGKTVILPTQGKFHIEEPTEACEELIEKHFGRMDFHMDPGGPEKMRAFREDVDRSMTGCTYG